MLFPQIRYKNNAVTTQKIAPGINGQVLATANNATTWTNLSSLLNDNTWNLNGNLLSTEKWLGTSNAYDLPFRVNNVEHMRINTAGNIGIGTASPDQKTYSIQKQ